MYAELPLLKEQQNSTKAQAMADQRVPAMLKANKYLIKRAGSQRPLLVRSAATLAAVISATSHTERLPDGPAPSGRHLSCTTLPRQLVADSCPARASSVAK